MNVISPGKKKTDKEPSFEELIMSVKKLKILLKETAKKKKEVEQNFSKEFKKLEKMETQLILWWDFWRREIEINLLQRKAGIGTLPSEREKINEQIEALNTHNKKLQESFSKGKIYPEVVAELKKELEEELLKEEKEKEAKKLG